jgi:hydrogenase maturation protease
MDPPTVAPTLVLGIGNILLKDEGVGVHVAQAMAAQAAEQGSPPPEEVEILDGGTSGADLLEVIANRQRVIVIDAVQAAGKPGTILRFTGEDLARKTNVSLSLHDLGLLETLQMAGHLGCAPREVIIFGVVPQDFSPGLEMTDKVAAAVPKVIELVRAELNR